MEVISSFLPIRSLRDTTYTRCQEWAWFPWKWKWVRMKESCMKIVSVVILARTWQEGPLPHLHHVFICQGYHTKYGRLDATGVFLTFLEVRSPTSRCWQSWFLLRPLSLVCKWLSSPCLHMVFLQWGCVSEAPLRTSVIFDDFILPYLL